MIRRATLWTLPAAVLLAGCGAEPVPERSAAKVPGFAVDADEAPPEQEPSFLSEENQRVILLFFPTESGERLLPEERVIFLTNTLGSQVKQAVSELLRGPQQEVGPVAAFPRNTRLLAVFLLDGTALIDLGGEARSIPGGSASELSAIYSLVDTVVFNFAEIERVQILIEGEEILTLTGHVSTSGPLRADLQRIDWTWMPEAEKLLHLDKPAAGLPDGETPAGEPALTPEPA